MALLFQPSIRARCVPSAGRPATDITDVLARRGTVYLLGRDDPYASASPLMTAVAEQVLDTALAMATASPYGKLTPSFLACLDELPSTTPLPTLRTRMANERALGLSFLYAAQTWRQMVVCYGEDEARSLFGLTNNIVVFGGGKDIHFYREVSDLLGTTSWCSPPPSPDPAPHRAPQPRPGSSGSTHQDASPFAGLTINALGQTTGPSANGFRYRGSQKPEARTVRPSGRPVRAGMVTDVDAARRRR